VRAPRALIDECINGGTPFMTNGCPDRSGKVACNRPFGGYRPGEEFRDYPFQPTSDDVEVIRAQARFDEIAPTGPRGEVAPPPNRPRGGSTEMNEPER
jgi:biotin synthase